MKVEITRYKSNTKEDKYRKGKLKKCSVVLDSSDSWSVDWTLATIAAPLIKQLKETSHSYGAVPKELVPDHLHSTYNPEGYSEEAWKWALGEIVFAMEEIANDNANEPPLYSKEGEMVVHPIDPETGFGEIEFVGYETTPEVKAVYKAYHDRVKKGCELLGVLFQSLWY